jgi:uncharacterized membrane protein
VYEVLESALTGITRYFILILEAVGVGIIVVTAVRCLIAGIRHNHIVPLMLGKGIALALEFMLASEVLRTVVSPAVQDLIVVGATVLLRGAMTILIHWESKNEEKEEKDTLKQEKA